MHASNLLDFSRAAVVLLLLLALIVRNTQCTNNRTSGRSPIRIKLHQKPRTLELANQLRACNLIDLDKAETRNLTQTLYKLKSTWPNETAGIGDKDEDQLRLCYAGLRSFGILPNVGWIIIGEPPQLFEALFDTGSDIIWVPDSRCRLNGATWHRSGRHNEYELRKSRTYRLPTNERLALDYANGLHIKGWWVTDMVEIEDVFDNSRSLKVYDQTLGLIGHIDGPAESHKPEFDAVVGLSFPSELSAGHTTFMENLFSSNKPLLDEQVFSFHINELATKRSSYQLRGELIFGYIDPTLYTGEIMWAPVVRTPLWEIRIHSVRLLDAHEPRTGPDSPQACICAHGCMATVNTGTSMILGTEADVAELNERLGFVRSKHMSDIYYAPGMCDRLRKGAKSLVFGIANNQHLELSPETYMVEAADAAPEAPICLSAIRSLETKSHTWILGAPFVSNFYTIFDYGQRRVGFAQPVRHIVH